MFANQDMLEAAKRGIVGRIDMCELRDVIGHAFYIDNNGRVVDVRLRYVGTREDVGCAR